MEMESTKKNNVLHEKCFICEEEAIDTCQYCTAGISYCGSEHLEIHRNAVNIDIDSYDKRSNLYRNQYRHRKVF